jgi:hypothetical protein
MDSHAQIACNTNLTLFGIFTGHMLLSHSPLKCAQKMVQSDACVEYIMSLVLFCLALLLFFFLYFTDFLEFFHAILLSEPMFCKYMMSLVWLYLTLLLLNTCDHMTFLNFYRFFGVFSCYTPF